MNSVVGFAMGISMASVIANAMNSAYTSTMRLSNDQVVAPPKYIHVIVNGKSMGPLTLGEVISMVQSGDITPETYMWKPGMADWKPAKDINDIGLRFEATPPQIP